MSPFKERTASFWKKVADEKCQVEVYTEKKGFKDCNKRVDHVHHITPEGTLLAQGEDPEHTVALPLCKKHHENFIEGDMDPVPYTENFSFHPDMGLALKNYPDYKAAQARANQHGLPPPETDFQKLAHAHHNMAVKGQRYHAGSEEVDQYYTEKMREKATRYVAEHPEDPKPDTKPHPATNLKKKKHWWE